MPALGLALAVALSKPLASFVSSFVRQFSTGVLGNGATYTRTGEATVVDHEGIVQTVPENCATFSGLRYVRNWCTSPNDITDWSATLDLVTKIDATTVEFSPARANAPWGEYGALNFSNIALRQNGNQVLFSVELSGVPGETLRIQVHSDGIPPALFEDITLTDTLTRYVVGPLEIDNPDEDWGWGPTVYIVRRTEHTATRVTVGKTMIEEVSGRADMTVPSEFVDDEDYGTGINRTRFFSTTNGNSVDANGVVTEGTGAPITGGHLLLEPTADNLVPESTDIDSWANNTACTVAPNDTVSCIAGHYADKLTGVSAVHDGKYKDTTVVVSTEYTISAYMKPDDTATCRFGIYAPTASTWHAYTDIDWSGGVPSQGTVHSGDSNLIFTEMADGWYRVQFTLTSHATDTVGRVLIQPDRDNLQRSLWFIGVQLEEGPFATNYIETSGSTATRATPALTYAQAVNGAEGTVIAQMAFPAGSPLTETSNLVQFETDGRPFYISHVSQKVALSAGANYPTTQIIPDAGDVYTFATRWEDGVGAKIGGYNVTDAGDWSWSSVGTYPADTYDTTTIDLAPSIKVPVAFYSLTLYDEALTFTWIEDRY